MRHANISKLSVVYGIALAALAGFSLGGCSGVGNLGAAPMAPQKRWCDLLPRPAYARLTQVAVGQDWFEVYRVADGVFAIYEPFQFQEIISYLILGERSALLFDTGMGIGRIRELTRELTDLPVRVLNSHTHIDHIGGNAEFDFVYAMDTPFTRTRANGVAAQDVAEEVAPAALCRPLPDGRQASDYAIRPFSINATVSDGTRIHLGGRTLEVLHIPGHTPDSIALLDRDNGLLWTGDSYYPGPIGLFADETDLRAYQTSVARLAALTPLLEHVLPAHNEPLASPDQLRELSRAVDAVLDEGVAPLRRDGPMLEYPGNGFTLIMRAPAE
jgi:glyoxylase-like metal-dependent hydrolase (beta-lactamase superfamily II)